MFDDTCPIGYELIVSPQSQKVVNDVLRYINYRIPNTITQKTN